MISDGQQQRPPGEARDFAQLHRDLARAVGRVCLERADGAVAVPARAGDIVVFSSLAPHRTGPNLKPGTVRKAYILQYAPAGAVICFPDGQRLGLDDPTWRAKVLAAGI